MRGFLTPKMLYPMKIKHTCNCNISKNDKNTYASSTMINFYINFLYNNKLYFRRRRRFYFD